MPRGKILQDGQIRFYCYTDYVLLAVTPVAAYKIARITWGRDGSIYVQFPYCTEKEGWIGELPIAPGQQGPVTYRLDEHGGYVATDVKFSHHTSGLVRFSKTGGEALPRAARQSWPLTGPLGHLFDLQVVEPERFSRLAKRDKRAMYLGAMMESGTTSLSWHAAWRRKRDFEKQLDPPDGVAGPTAHVMSRLSGQVSETFFLGQPEGFGARDHILLLTSATPKVPGGFAGSGMTFLGGWDHHEVARSGENPQLGGCLAFVYPFRRTQVKEPTEVEEGGVRPGETSGEGQQVQGELEDHPVIPYDQFIAERNRVLDARARVQQRVDQLVTGGAVGALILSITFLEKIAPAPEPSSRGLLIAAWGLLLLCLGLNLASHFASCSAFDRYLMDYDKAYREKSDCSPDNRATRVTRWTAMGAALSFVIGVGFLAIFALVNVPFDAPAGPRRSSAERTTNGETVLPQPRGPNAYARDESGPAETPGAAATAATPSPAAVSRTP